MTYNRIVALFVFLPWLVILVELAILFLAQHHGCTISAAGPQTCLFGGVDFGNVLYPLWSLGYQIAYSFLWVIPACLIWAIWSIVRAMNDAKKLRSSVGRRKRAKKRSTQPEH